SCQCSAQHGSIRYWPARTGRVCGVAIDPAAQLQELRGRMFIGRHRWAEGEKAQILEQIVQLVKGGILLRPQRITASEEVRREGTQAKQVIAAKDDHVDAEVVAGQYHEVRPLLIPEG